MYSHLLENSKWCEFWYSEYSTHSHVERTSMKLLTLFHNKTVSFIIHFASVVREIFNAARCLRWGFQEKCNKNCWIRFIYIFAYTISSSMQAVFDIESINIKCSPSIDRSMSFCVLFAFSFPSLLLLPTLSIVPILFQSPPPFFRDTRALNQGWIMVAPSSAHAPFVSRFRHVADADRLITAHICGACTEI